MSLETNIKSGVSHIMHPEDLALSHGIRGINTALDTLGRFVRRLEDQAEDLEDERGPVVVSEKIDGAPSLYFGKDDQGRFFVSTKSILSKNQKLGYSLADIQRLWTTGVQDVLMCAWKALKPVFKKSGTVMQGDLLWCSHGGKKVVDHEGQKFLTFQPNTILYAVPVDKKSEIYKEVKAAQLGIVVHGIYKATNDATGRVNMDRMPDKAIRPAVEELNQAKSVFIIDPFVDNIDAFEGSDEVVDEVKDLIRATEAVADEIDPAFDEEWNDNDNPMIKEAKRLIPIFVTQQVRTAGDAESIITAKNEDAFLKTFKKKMKEFISARSEQEQSKLKSSKGKERKAEHFKEFQKWMEDMESTFEPMLRAFFRMFSLKILLFKIFGNVEKKLGQTFVVDKKNDFEMIATKPEGYVLLNGPNMVKIVDRAEFSRNNLLYSPFNEEKEIIPSGGTTGDPESIGDKKHLKIKSITNEIFEDVLNAIEGTKEVTGFNEVDAVDQASRTKGYNVLWVGKMQPPTKAHIEVLGQLSKIFNKVLLLVTDKGKYVDPELSVELIKSALRKAELRNVEVKLGRKEGALDPLKSTFGISSKKPETAQESVQDMIKFFGLDEGDAKRPFVLAQGQEEAGKKGEEDRFSAIKSRGTMFVVNDGEEPSEDKPFGLYGIPILRTDKGEKIGARMVREMVGQGEIEDAKEAMAPGDDDIKDSIIDSMTAKMQANEEYFHIEGFAVDKELIKELSEERYIDQAEAMDLILDILQGE
jgi:hypothetical protein